MRELKRFQVRGVPGEVTRVDFDGRIVDYWLPTAGATHLLVAHDGQNVFDGRTSTHRGQTWKMAQSAIHVSRELEITPPAIIAVWHSSSKEDPWGRGRDLVPEKYFREGLPVEEKYRDIFNADFLHGDSYLQSIFNEYIPAIAPGISPSRTAMIGGSMGGLAALYAMAEFPEKFTTSLALSPHWPFGRDGLVKRMITSLPDPATHKIWMSHGTKGLDKDYAPFQILADKLMRERGYGDHDFISKVFQRSGHNERSWARYLDQPMRFWLSE